METEVYVYVDIAGTPHLAGRLWARVLHINVTLTFAVTAAQVAQGPKALAE
jgi:hypothetical protein